MLVGLIGKKCGMTRVFTQAGESIPVTVVEVRQNRVVQIKTVESDGYSAIQVAYGNKKASRVNRPTAGHCEKHGVEAGELIREFRLDHCDGFEAGQELTVNVFKVGEKVDVSGVSKGKGFAGGVKRHHFAMQDATHGNSISHRAPGSIGQCQTPGRVFKGKKMAGHLGNVNRTIQNLEVIRIDESKGLLLIKGGVPGPISGRLIIRHGIKAKH